jgi:hypothetical protein
MSNLINSYSLAPVIGIGTDTPNQNLTVVGGISSNALIYDQTGNSSQWNSAYNIATGYQSNSGTFATNTLLQSTSALLTPLTTTNTLTSQLVLNTAFNSYQTSVASSTAILLPTSVYQNASGSFVKYTDINSVSGNWNTAYQALSTNPHILNQTLSSTTTLIGSNTANNTFSEVLGGQCNLASGTYSTIVNGFSSCATGYATFVGAGSGIRATGDYSVVNGGQCNTASGCYSFVGGGTRNITCSQFGGSTNISNAVVVGGTCNIVSNNYSIIGGGLGNYNPLRDSQIVGGVANHTGGLTPFNITAAASISGNGSQTCLIGTGIQSCFSYPFTSGNVSVYYATANNPLSAGTFSTATIAATGTNYIIINGDYSTCTGTSLSATSIYVYDRAINNTGYDNFIGGGKLNTASGCYTTIAGGFNNRILTSVNNTPATFSVIGGGCGNTASAYFATVAGGQGNCAICKSTVAGGQSNSASGYAAFVGGGQSNCSGGRNASIVGGGSNCTTSSCSFVGGGVSNCVSGGTGVIVGGGNNGVTGGCSALVGGRCGTISGAYSTIVGGKFNYNPLFNSSIEGGSFNHMGGYAPANITFGANLSGNGACTVLCSPGIGSCFSTSGTTGAVSLMWMTSGTANSTLSSACFTTANVVTNAANCIIINGDYSTCSTGFSACSVYVYDRCLNQSGCFNFIGGGVLNTASGCYNFIGGGFRHNSAGSTSSIVGGSCNLTHCTTYDSFIGGGIQNSICTGGRNAVVGGFGNNAFGYVTFIGGGRFNNTSSGAYIGIVAGCLNNATGNCSFIGAGASNNVCGGNASIVGGGCNLITTTGTGSIIGGGACNNISSAYSFVAGGSANDTKGFANTFILGTALSASAANYTYVNNLSVQGNIASNTTYTATAYLSADTTVPTNLDLWLPLSVKNDPNNWITNVGTYPALSGKITPTVPGYYFVSYQVAWNGTTGTGQNNIQIRVNGNSTTKSLAQMPLFTGSGGAQTLNATATVYLNGTTDYLNFSGYSSGTGQTIKGTTDGNWTRVEIFKIN